MNTIPRRKLCDIIAQYGISLIDNPMRCRELILDFCGDFQREVFLLNTALFHKIPAELMNSKNILPAAVLVSILAKRLRDTTGLSGESAFWAVESWAIALGLIPEGENTIQFKNLRLYVLMILLVSQLFITMA